MTDWMGVLCVEMNMEMSNRVTVILGAGAVSDFDFGGEEPPTTQNLTATITKIPVQRCETGEYDLFLIKEVYDKLNEELTKKYKSLHTAVRWYDPEVNFEEVIDALEDLCSSFSNEGTLSCLFSPTIEHMWVEYDRAIYACIKTIIEKVDEYSTVFKSDPKREGWYKGFWQSFNNKADIFNLNYDTTIETSLGDNYEDGFIETDSDYQRFLPQQLMKNPCELSTLNHLHGCILYSDVNPYVTQYEYSERDLYKRKAYSPRNMSCQSVPADQAKDAIYYTPIIVGLKKPDKICYLPHSYYHANLANKILENPGLLIVGYSFGDIYVNQLIGKHKLIHGANQRVVIIDRFKQCIDADKMFLLQAIFRKSHGGLWQFIGRQLEEITPFEASKKMHQGSPFFWESNNGTLRIYTSGFKSAVADYYKDILSFLL